VLRSGTLPRSSDPAAAMSAAMSSLTDDIGDGVCRERKKRNEQEYVQAR
jgi:hypothetical protein